VDLSHISLYTGAATTGLGPTGVGLAVGLGPTGVGLPVGLGPTGVGLAVGLGPTGVGLGLGPLPLSLLVCLFIANPKQTNTANHTTTTSAENKAVKFIIYNYIRIFII
jgi:hypothetical protein